MGNDRRRLADARAGTLTVLADDAVFEGRLSGSGCVVVSGRFEGDCDLRGSVTLAEGGHWLGTLTADNVIIAGRVEGDVLARQRVEVGTTARITGTLSGQSVAIASGAVIDGEIRTGTPGEAPIRFEEKRGR